MIRPDAPPKIERLTPSASPREDDALRLDSERARALLHDIAVELALLGVGRGAAVLHLRALVLKRDVARWTSSSPAPVERQTLIEDLLALHERAKTAREGR